MLYENEKKNTKKRKKVERKGENGTKREKREKRRLKQGKRANRRETAHVPLALLIATFVRSLSQPVKFHPNKGKENRIWSTSVS